MSDYRKRYRDYDAEGELKYSPKDFFVMNVIILLYFVV